MRESNSYPGTGERRDRGNGDVVGRPTVTLAHRRHSQGAHPSGVQSGSGGGRAWPSGPQRPGEENAGGESGFEFGAETRLRRGVIVI